MIGIPYNINTCIFITSQTLNADQFNPNVPASGNKSTHNCLWDTVNKSLIWIDTLTNLIVFEIAGGGGLPFGNDVGVVDAYQTIISGATLTDGYAFEIKIANTNTGASTLQLNALGVLPFLDVNGDPLVAGMIEADSIYIATYNTTFGGYQLLGESKPGVAITNNVIPKGNGVSITDGSWSFAANDIIPNVYGSNIGDDTHRIGTIFMASNFDYASNLDWINGTDIRMTLTTGGALGIGTTSPVQTLHVEAPLGGYGIRTSTGLNYVDIVPQGSNFIEFLTNRNGYEFISDLASLRLTRSGAVGPALIYGLNLDAITIGDNTGTPIFTANYSNLSVGIGTTTPTARLHVVGVDNTVANYALKVENNVGSPLLVVNNAGLVGIGIASPTNYLHIVSPFFAGGMQVNSANTSYLNLYGVGGGVINMGAEFGATPLQIQGIVGVGGILRVTDGFAIRNFINNVGIFRAANVDTYPNWAMGDHLGGTIIEANTRLVIYGQNVASTDYILKLKDGNGLGPVDVFTARNDGHITMNQLPTSSAGLSAGELWNNAGVVNIV